jgi:cell filamentation protein
VPSWDPYLDLESGVLRNHLGIADPIVLSRAEAAATTAALSILAIEPLRGDYDLAHLQAFHRAIFGGLYPWAGEVRTVSLGKAGQLFCPPEVIERRAREIFLALAVRDRLQGLRREPFLDALTELLAALNHLHPFREGNGRAQRAFLAQLARAAGYRLSWAGLDGAQNTDASRAAHGGDLKPLRAMLDPLLGT